MLYEIDKVVSAFALSEQDIFISTMNAYGLWFEASEIPLVGLKTSGVKSINLKDDKVVAVSNFNSVTCEYISVITEKGTGKRVKLSEFDKSSRAKRGLMILREVKTNPYKVVKTFAVSTKHMLGIKTNDIKCIKLTELPIVDRYSTGSVISKEKINDCFLVTDLQSKKDLLETKEGSKVVEVKPIEQEKISLKEIDDRLLTIEDFLNSD